MWTERRKNYSEQLFSTAVVFPLAILQKKILTNTHTHTYTHKISYYPNPCCTLGLCMCFLRVCVCMCVGSAVPPGCPETNWQFEKLWLQGKASKTRDGDKEERESRREREIESGGKKRNKTQQHPQREGRLSKVWPTVTLSVWCWQSPLHAHFPGEKPRRGRESLHSDTDVAPFVAIFLSFFWFLSSTPLYFFSSKQYLRVENNSSFNPPPPSFQLNSRFMWTRPRAPPHCPLFPVLLFLCNYFTFKTIILLNTETKQ